MVTPARAVVAGGSLGGLLAANLLLRAGWDVHVYERVDGPLAGRGVGIVTHPELLDVLRAAGIDVARGIGVSVPSRLAFGLDGAVIGQLPLPQVLTSWSFLYGKLKAAYPEDRYHSGKSVARYVARADSVEVHFTDEQVIEAELLVGADGIRSIVRRQMHPQVEPRYAGYVAWRGTADERDLPAATHAALFERFAFCLPPQEQMLGYPIAGEAETIVPGRRRYNFVWYRPADDARLRHLMTDEKGRHYPEGIPPNAVDPAVIAGVRRDAEQVLSPQFADVVRAARQLFFQPIYDLASPSLRAGRVVLLGDAAFVARPHCGMGVTKAAGDAEALVAHLAEADSLDTALVAYDRSRTAFGELVLAHARHLGAYMQAQILTDEERMMAERYRDTDAVLRETAVFTKSLVSE